MITLDRAFDSVRRQMCGEMTSPCCGVPTFVTLVPVFIVVCSHVQSQAGGGFPPYMQGRHAEKGGWYPKGAKNKGAPLFANRGVPKRGKK